jgi:3-phosphoshikimate 1-carboxyvinyltransferase
MRIELPISKSIANRLLILQAIHGDGLLTVSDCYSLPDDVQLLYQALRLVHIKSSPRRSQGVDCERNVVENKVVDIVDLNLHIGNCGTAMRFLTAYCAQLEGTTVILDGVERMHHRPIGQLVDALREIGAQIDYLGAEGYPPLRIKGCILDKQRLVTINNPQSTQFVSALLLIGANVQTDSTSPYITLTRALIKQYALVLFTEDSATSSIFLERDWSSAAFWYEYVALHGGAITLPGLYRDSLQGDKVVADIFTRLGVQTTYTAEGITIVSTGVADLQHSDLQGIDAQAAAQQSAEAVFYQDFSACPDLYPAVALTCERLGIALHATGTDSLPLKESDRLRAVREHRTDHDHRMAMALLIAGYEVDDTDCIRKSYPQFLEQYHRICQPILGKK